MLGKKRQQNGYGNLIPYPFMQVTRTNFYDSQRNRKSRAKYRALYLPLMKMLFIFYSFTSK